MARVISLIALFALGLTEAPVHEPVHGHHCERLMATTERYHAPREIRQLVIGMPSRSCFDRPCRIPNWPFCARDLGPGTWDLGSMIEGLAYGQSGGLRPSGRAVAIGWRWC